MVCIIPNSGDEGGARCCRYEYEEADGVCDAMERAAQIFMAASGKNDVADTFVPDQALPPGCPDAAGGWAKA